MTMNNDDWMEAYHPRRGQEALDELHRELCVRKRCFPRWIREGRVSATDARDRIDRLQTAYDLLANCIAKPVPEAVTSSGDKTSALPEE